MSVTDRYIFRQALLAFAVVLGVLTLVVWLTTALRQLETITAQGQTVGIFLMLTSLALPMLIMQIAPFALFIGTVFTLNKMSADSELVVISASGVSEQRVMRPFLMLALCVALAGWLFSLVLVPSALRELRSYVTGVRADLISTIIQPGKFTAITKDLTFHVRERANNGALLGVFVNDRRDGEMELTYLSTKGLIVRTVDGTYLVLENGQIIRRPKGKETGSIIAFDRYAFNLSAFMSDTPNTDYTPSERTMGELFSPQAIPNVTPEFLNQARSELHNRLTLPFYSLAFVMVAFAALGRARTTRHNRSQTIMIAIVAIVLLRVAGFGVSGLTQRSAAATPLIYLVPLIGIGLGALLGPYLPQKLRGVSLDAFLPLKRAQSA